MEQEEVATTPLSWTVAFVLEIVLLASMAQAALAIRTVTGELGRAPGERWGAAEVSLLAPLLVAVVLVATGLFLWLEDRLAPRESRVLALTTSCAWGVVAAAVGVALAA